MADTIEPLAEDNVTPTAEDSKDTIDAGQQDHRQDIFDEQFQALMNGFGAACEQQNIQTAIAIAKHPTKDEPIVFYRGHLIDAAALAASVLRQIKQQLFEELRTEPK